MAKFVTCLRYFCTPVKKSEYVSAYITDHTGAIASSKNVLL